MAELNTMKEFDKMSMTTTISPRSDVPLPAGADGVDDWEDPARTGLSQPSRYFTGTIRVVSDMVSDDQRPLGAIQVVIAGTQYADGTVRREILVDRTSSDEPLTAEWARELGQAILAAADEADAMARRDAALSLAETCETTGTE